MSIVRQRLPAYALFAALLSAAGLPIYIHAPKFFVDEYGVSLAALGAVLFGLRLLDVVQDPLLGRLSETLRDRRGIAVVLATAIMAAAMFGLFAITPPGSPLIWFGVMLTLVFSAFSFLTICFYAQGVAKADAIRGNGHLKLARWRETGALLGICVASVAPVVLGKDSSYRRGKVGQASLRARQKQAGCRCRSKDVVQLDAQVVAGIGAASGMDCAGGSGPQGPSTD